ncbi:MAG TPA: beta-L-arabinofuranosidase domain-containing protein, partial [Acidobacteriaceae bacterium]|nr:beta-L-arabinofuranosidase domain-containing protein [Acidobacteriaceae bacterium]
KGEIRSGGFDLNGLWSPWYVEHKLFAGLRDAYHLTGNRTALDVEIKFAGWVESIVGNLNDDQIQKMLATEFGGMNEVLADLSVDTNDPRWMKLSDKFEHRAVVEPLSKGEDILAGKHSNANIPKMIGELARYIDTGNETDGKAAEFFFDEVSEHHSFATGGNGKNEYFGQPDKMNDMIDGRTAESCSTYNMIKMARTLFTLEPDARYADFVERADLNAILGGQDPDDGRVSYMVPVGRGVQHEYQTKFDSFTCCVGSQMEMHAFHAYGIYDESGNKLWVNLYAPTTVDWTSQGIKLEMVTDLPMGDAATLKVTSGKTKVYTIAFRRPYWAVAGFTVKVNGKPVQNISKPDTYIAVTRTWKVGDTVELALPKTLRKEPLPDNPNRMAIMWGPLVLAGDLGPELNRRAARGNGSAPEPAPALVTAASLDGWLKPVADKPGTFRTVNVGLKEDIDFAPFYEMPRRRYAIYWDVFTPTEWAKKSEAYQAEQDSEKKLEAATIGFAQPGQMQAERDFAEKGEDTTPVQLNGRYGRQGNSWFSYDLPVDPATPAILVVTYSNEVRGRQGGVDVLVDGTKVGEQTMPRRTPEQDIRFFDVKYPLPLDIVKGKQKVTVRFQAKDGDAIPGVFGIRTVRADAAQDVK